jgi:hypothetical protein
MKHDKQSGWLSWLSSYATGTDQLAAQFAENRQIIERKHDPGCADVLYACTQYGNLRIGELLALFGGDPSVIVESIEKYRKIGYIVINEQQSGDFDRFLLKVRELEVLPRHRRNWEASSYLADHAEMGMGLGLTLTPKGSIAARISIGGASLK